MMSVCCVGAGFVGGSLSTVLAERGIDVYQFDKAGKKSPGVNPVTFNSVTEMSNHCQQDPNFSGVYFICLPTPMQASGDCDLSIVEGVLLELASIPGNHIAVVKSTVPPGSVARWNEQLPDTRLQVVHSPEFLREATALEDMRNQDRIVLGGNERAIAKVRAVFEAAFPGVPVIETTSTESELIKYIANCFLATKVSFANEMYQICQKLHINYDNVIGAATLDKRLGKSHWDVPGPMPCDLTGKPSMGFSGSCFPKDLNALISLATKLGVKATMLKAAWNKNLEVRPQRDWEKLQGRAVSIPRYRVIKTGPFPIPDIKVPIHPTVEKISGPFMDLFSEKN
jgi:UDPglucose 6-dehydrogenase